ncbi:uncharacterized protein ATC70_010917 [Mucor velutinosus]|uniref:Yeast cell wall synthesis Kre9/Knh1-like N-terminal domain-containing protein n=1 Tax=Mucor velutinosus TaxID=708070 RepID=A0AAN7DEG9_9FUNG|nr:hypothetical protein ATC70_010917 [Mucor velutinosus]
MKFIATLSALVAGAITLVRAQQPAVNQQDAGVYFTNPVLGSVFQADAPYSLTWTAIPNAVDDKIDAIELRMGSASNLELIQTINTQPIPLALGKFDWVPSKNLTTATSYVLLAKNSQGISYSAYFTIIGQAPGVQTNSTSSVALVATAALSTAMPQSSVASNASSSIMMTASASAPASALPSSMMPTAVSVASSMVSAMPSAHVGHLGVSVSGATNLKAGLVGAAGAIGAAIVMMI